GAINGQEHTIGVNTDYQRARTIMRVKAGSQTQRMSIQHYGRQQSRPIRVLTSHKIEPFAPGSVNTAMGIKMSPSDSIDKVGDMRPPSGKYLSHTALVGIAYFAAARLGLAVPFTSGNVSPVWPAAGIALASLLLLGYRVWPGIALGAFLANLLSPIPHMAAAGLALGNTLAALAGAFMLRRLPTFNTSLSRLID